MGWIQTMTPVNWIMTGRVYIPYLPSSHISMQLEQQYITTQDKDVIMICFCVSIYVSSTPPRRYTGKICKIKHKQISQTYPWYLLKLFGIWYVGGYTHCALIFNSTKGVTDLPLLQYCHTRQTIHMGVWNASIQGNVGSSSSVNRLQSLYLLY